MSMIEIKNASKKYNVTTRAEIIALDNVSLTIEAGEFIAIKGPSGTGKSTLMHIIGCTDKATSAEYLLDGENISEVKSSQLAKLRNAKFGFVMQDFGLVNDDTVLNNVSLPLMFNRTPLNKINDIALERLKDMGIEHVSNRIVNDLSGGEKQRVAIARALVNNPEIILADEPTGSLDTENSTLIMSIFKSLNMKGKTVVIITHEDSIANQCRRIICMSDGKIISDTLK